MNIDDTNEAGRLLDPDGWIDITEIGTQPAGAGQPESAGPPMACCDRPYEDHPQGDPTMFGTCRIHSGVEISMHWNGRSYMCGQCARDDFHARPRRLTRTTD